ncbi:MAG: acetylhydrolase [Anaerolineales bacterium]
MGTIILIIALVIEAAFATYCIITKSNQRKVRSFVRIGAFAAFVIFTLVSVLQWGFRWYLLAALLLIWAAIGIWTLGGRKAVKIEFKSGRVVGRAIGMLVLVFLAVTPALIFPQHAQPKMTGTHAVATVSYTYTDPNRIETFANTGAHREVNVEFWYPKDGGGPYPLVVFSHGTAAMKTSNTSTFMDLASNGYVVCSVDHPYHSLYTVDDARHVTIIDRAYLREYLDVNGGMYSEPTTTRLNQKWMSLRIADVNFVLDTVLAKAKDTSSGAVYQMIDRGKIGLIGHSLGGESMAQVARERSDIGAVVNLDADLAGEYRDYVNGKFVLNDRLYPVPLLNIFSDVLERLMSAVPDPTNAIAVKHVVATAPKAYEVHFIGTDHMSFTDLPLVSPLLVSVINSSVPKAGGIEVDPLETIERMNDLVLKFFNAYLKGEGSFTVAGTY